MVLALGMNPEFKNMGKNIDNKLWLFYMTFGLFSFLLLIVKTLPSFNTCIINN